MPEQNDPQRRLLYDMKAAANTALPPIMTLAGALLIVAVVVKRVQNRPRLGIAIDQFSALDGVAEGLGAELQHTLSTSLRMAQQASSSRDGSSGMLIEPMSMPTFIPEPWHDELSEAFEVEY
jgi:hypothetical protein